MFRIRKSKTFFKDRVKKLMRRKNNKQLKSMIEKEEMYPTLSDSTGTTLLHLAARYGNAEMIKYSINSGCEVDAKDSSGTTPLMIATKYNHCLAMKFLLDANANIFTTNASEEYPLQLMFDRYKTVFYHSIMKLYFEKAKSSSSSDEELVEILLKAGCSLDQIAIVQSPKVTQIFLEKVDIIDDVTSCRSVLISMFLIDPENLKVLLHHGSQATERIEDFLWYLHDTCNAGIIQTKQSNFFSRPRISETLRTFAKSIMDWGILDQQNLKFLKYIFEDANKDILEIFLESGIHEYVQNRFGYNLLAHIYGNGNAGVIQLLENTNVEACCNTGDQGVTALHLAVYRCIPGNVKLLLDLGADPNVADESGETPLFCVLNSREPLTNKIECVDLLLKNNADVEICDNSDSCFIEYIDLENKDHLTLVEPVLAHLAMLQAMNLPVKRATLQYINVHDELRIRFDTCQRQLEEMKIRKVARSFSLITVLTSKPDTIARFVGAQIGKIIRTLMCGDRLRELNGYYSKQFKERLDRALKVHRLRSEVNHLIGESIPTFNGYNPVVDKIVSFFDFEELMAFC